MLGAGGLSAFGFGLDGGKGCLHGALPRTGDRGTPTGAQRPQIGPELAGVVQSRARTLDL